MLGADPAGVAGPSGPKPYVRHKTADEILDSLANYCQRINDSGH